MLGQRMIDFSRAAQSARTLSTFNVYLYDIATVGASALYTQGVRLGFGNSVGGRRVIGRNRGDRHCLAAGLRRAQSLGGQVVVALG